MTSENKKVVDGEASETDEESDNLASGLNLKESIENALNANSMTQSMVVQGEASESDEELPRIQNIKVTETPINRVPVSQNEESGFLMRDLQEDVTNSLKWLIQDTQEVALEELRHCNQLLLSSQVTLQKDANALKTAANNLECISQKLDDILSFNLIPHIEFQKKSPEEADFELGVDTLTNEMIDML